MAAAPLPPPQQQQPLVLYDISSPLQPPRSYAPNPAKARLALGFKRAPFTTAWVDLPDIPAVRKGLGCPAVRKLDDGSDYFTLPMLWDPASGTVVGDSFDIAVYLEEALPDAGAGRLFPPDAAAAAWLDYESPHSGEAFVVPLSPVQGTGKHAAYARFNMQVDATFTAHVALAAEFLPFNPGSAEEVRATFVKRAHLTSWDQLCIPRGEKRRQLVAAFEGALAPLAQLLAADGGGPFFDGARATYADLIVGGWLAMLSETMPEWGELRGWHGGVFARLHDALRESYFVCT